MFLSWGLSVHWLLAVRWLLFVGCLLLLHLRRGAIGVRGRGGLWRRGAIRVRRGGSLWGWSAIRGQGGSSLQSLLLRRRRSRSPKWILGRSSIRGRCRCWSTIIITGGSRRRITPRHCGSCCWWSPIPGRRTPWICRLLRLHRSGWWQGGIGCLGMGRRCSEEIVARSGHIRSHSIGTGCRWSSKVEQISSRGRLRINASTRGRATMRLFLQ
mmetsp:Transcript_46392/g.130654  ORF Transcript_46392/g.130654 Transcript_46392/m.130654 type:complete len:212 (+) Transcript_46392:938-1573(+)